MSFNPRHPFGGTPYHREELIRRRDDWYAVITRRSHDLAERLHQAPAQYPSNPNLLGTEISAIQDASLLDFSSRVRTPRVGQIVVFENHASRYAAAKIVTIENDTRGALRDWLEFDFWIIESGSDEFQE